LKHSQLIRRELHFRSIYKGTHIPARVSLLRYLITIRRAEATYDDLTFDSETPTDGDVHAKTILLLHTWSQSLVLEEQNCVKALKPTYYVKKLTILTMLNKELRSVLTRDSKPIRKLEHLITNATKKSGTNKLVPPYNKKSKLGTSSNKTICFSN